MDLRVVIAGSFGFMDIGDEAMLTEDLRYIRDTLGIADRNLFIFGDDPDYVSRFHGHPRDNCIASARLQRHGQALSLRGRIGPRIRQIASSLVRGREIPRRDGEVGRILSQADAALITGGGTINTRDADGYSLTRMHDMILSFKTHGLPVFLSGQTIGPLGEHRNHDKMAAEIVGWADVLTVRDSLYSRRYLDLIGATPADLLETFDDAYTLDYAGADLPPDTRDFLAKDPPAAALNITEYTSATQGQRAFVARLCNWLVGEDKARVLLLSHTPRDLVRLYQIYDMCAAETKPSLHLPDTRLWSGAQLKKAISQCRAAIGGRYHFIVFAGTSDTPFIGMCGNHYSYIKQNGFAAPLGLSRMILNEQETWDFDIVTARYREMKDAVLDLSNRFKPPSESMLAFGEWLRNRVKR